MGAAIAAGNHLENGIWADLVMPAIIMVKQIKVSSGDAHMFSTPQWPW